MGIESPHSGQQIRKNGKLERATWDEAMDLIVKKSKDIIEHLTPHAISFYVRPAVAPGLTVCLLLCM